MFLVGYTVPWADRSNNITAISRVVPKYLPKLSLKVRVRSWAQIMKACPPKLAQTSKHVKTTKIYIYKLLLRPKARKDNGNKYLHELHISDIRNQKICMKISKTIWQNICRLQRKQLKLNWRVGDADMYILQTRHSFWISIYGV